MRQYEDMMYWIRDRETFLASDDIGRDLEHVEALQRKFEDFQKVWNFFFVKNFADTVYVTDRSID